MVELPMGIVENHLKQIQIAEDWDVMPKSNVNRKSPS